MKYNVIINQNKVIQFNIVEEPNLTEFDNIYEKEDKRHNWDFDEALDYEEKFLNNLETTIQQSGILKRVRVVRRYSEIYKHLRTPSVNRPEERFYHHSSVIKKSYKKKKLNKCNERTSF